MRCRYYDLEFDEVYSTICPYCGKDNEKYIDDWDNPDNCSDEEYMDDDDYDDFDN